MHRKVLSLIEMTHMETMYNKEISDEFLTNYYSEIRGLKEEFSKNSFTHCANEANKLKALPPNQIESYYGKISFWDRIYVNSHMGIALGLIFKERQTAKRQYLLENTQLLELILAKLKFH